jgi:hypothetical protein
MKRATSTKIYRRAIDVDIGARLTPVFSPLVLIGLFVHRCVRSSVTSSTEAEFIAAVHAGKIAKYLRSVLDELGFPPVGPTLLYEDNEAAIAMINDNRPTVRARHVDIQHFAIQEWRARGIVRMEHIPTILNVADGSTKALGWTLHSRHARRAMGHHGRIP